MKSLADEVSNQQISCGKLTAQINIAYNFINEKNITKHLFEKDASLWKKDSKQTKEISERLGWLTLPENYKQHVASLIEFSNQIKKENYTHAVLLGMGGSSLCSEVARQTFGSEKGFPELLVLDNTSTEAILDLEEKINIDKTLFIVASKSGNTEETLSFFHYFYKKLEDKKFPNPGNNFVAITDDGTPLVKFAKENNFRKTFLNQPDLGGRYSVLSDFGLVPMALMGLDIGELLASAKQMEDACQNSDTANNPGVSLGVVLGICQQHKKDKVTFVLSSSINSFGYWVEQLLAESTGKEGRGLIPVNGEELGAPDVYGSDRVFIHMYLDSDNNEADEKKLTTLENAGHPIVRIKLKDKLALGGEYYRWEIAAAISGLIMDINPFDQPNVEESKKNTSDILADWIKDGSFKKTNSLINADGISIYGSKKTKEITADHRRSIGDFVNSFTSQSKPNDYIALLPYFLMTDSRENILQSWRQTTRDELKIATTLLNGPRYLHSTGQLHKGGPDTGLYIILVCDDEKELSIPNEKFGFATLHRAQALGDFRSLDDKGRRVIRIHLGKDIDAGLDKLYQSVK